MNDPNYPEPGPGKIIDELRDTTYPKICHYCGKLAAPQLMRVHFESYENWYTHKWAWRIAFFTHPQCSPQ